MYYIDLSYCMYFCDEIWALWTSFVSSNFIWTKKVEAKKIYGWVRPRELMLFEWNEVSWTQHSGLVYAYSSKHRVWE